MATPLPGRPPIQDLPPPGGYPAIKYARNMRNRGPPGWVLYAGVIAMTYYGFYSISKTNVRKIDDYEESRESRIAMMPTMQHENDLFLANFIRKEREMEEEIMKDVPGWKMHESVYRTGFFQRKAHALQRYPHEPQQDKVDDLLGTLAEFSFRPQYAYHKLIKGLDSRA